MELKSNPRPGTTVPVQAYLKDRSEPVSLPDALQITGPLPVVASSKLSLPTSMTVSIKPSEFPAGYMLSAMLDAKNIESRSVLRLGCADDAASPAFLRVGEQTSTSSLQQLSEDQLFLSFDTSALPAGCSLQAVIDNGRDGKSLPYTLAQIIRVPEIESFEVTGDPLVNAMHTYALVGRNLEMIEKVGWDDTNGIEVPGLPAPVPGEGQKQTLARQSSGRPELAGCPLHLATQR